MDTKPNTNSSPAPVPESAEVKQARQDEARRSRLDLEDATTRLLLDTKNSCDQVDSFMRARNGNALATARQTLNQRFQKASDNLDKLTQLDTAA